MTFDERRRDLGCYGARSWRYGERSRPRMRHMFAVLQGDVNREGRPGCRRCGHHQTSGAVVPALPTWSRRLLDIQGSPGIRFNEHIEGDGPTVFAHACKMGLEGIVSKRKDSMYRSGRSPDWVKMKNPVCKAATRESEEDWS
jgi:hypothetical protein